MSEVISLTREEIELLFRALEGLMEIDLISYKDYMLRKDLHEKFERMVKNEKVTT